MAKILGGGKYVVVWSMLLTKAWPHRYLTARYSAPVREEWAALLEHVVQVAGELWEPEVRQLGLLQRLQQAGSVAARARMWNGRHRGCTGLDWGSTQEVRTGRQTGYNQAGSGQIVLPMSVHLARQGGLT